MTKNKTVSVAEFGKICADILKTDRWVFIGCDGDMGSGKSCFTDKLSRAISKNTGKTFSYDKNMTYLRTELKTFCDGDSEGKGQMPEYSSILCDELISMFFKRNWHDFEQIDGIELLNKVRDRHLAVCGNIPNFWDLDSAIYPMITFWIHIHERGRAWVFERDPNPFVKDKWNVKDNVKLFAKAKNPYGCKGFVCEIEFDDWTPSEKENYYNIRNVKRKHSEGQRNAKAVNRSPELIKQRDKLIAYLFEQAPKSNATMVSRIIGVDQSHVNKIKTGKKDIKLPKV